MKIVLTGGGTAGHVTPNIALLPYLKDFDIIYIGSHTGIEKNLIEKEGIKYHSISVGKLRRYISLENIKDIFREIRGIGQARKILKKEKPDVIFSKGGFVSVPVVIAGYFLKIPVILHESDITPGLANKICARFASKICVSFEETQKYFKNAILTGTPIRDFLLNGVKKSFFEDDKPVILAMGGSLGSEKINTVLREALPELLKEFNIIHICGKGNTVDNIAGYIQFEYVNDELADIFATCDIAISRAGANAITEFKALALPMLLIPLGLNASRGDQIVNAAYFESMGFAKILTEENLFPKVLANGIKYLYNKKENYVENMKHHTRGNAAQTIADIIKRSVAL